MVIVANCYVYYYVMISNLYNDVQVMLMYDCCCTAHVELYIHMYEMSMRFT